MLQMDQGIKMYEISFPKSKHWCYCKQVCIVPKNCMKILLTISVQMFNKSNLLF